jgi:uncharacterized protein YodC (DUF2158 family)
MIEVGQVVQINSGSILFTVSKVNDDGTCNLVWYDPNRGIIFREDKLPVTVLITDGG